MLSAIGYGLVLLYVTVLSRRTLDQMHYQLKPLWEYRQAFRFENGRLQIRDIEYAWYIANNILVFVPCGVLLGELLRTNGKNAFFRTLCIGCLVSASLEIGQLVFRIGLFEVDDILNNGIGVILGFWIFRLAEKIGRFRPGSCGKG